MNGDAMNTGGPALSTLDAAAVDCVLQGASDGAVDGARLRRARDLLALLDPPYRADAALIDVTFARVLRSGARAEEPALGPDDHEALEAWVMAGYDATRVAASLRERAQRHQALAALITTVGLSRDAERLVERTMRRVEREEERRRTDMNFAAASERRRGGPRIRLADVVSVAAVLLIGASIVWPTLGALREHARRDLCLTNLHSTAAGLSMYAGAHRDSLPMVAAGLDGGKWWDVGRRHSNSANLFELARGGYVTLANLACPGNPEAPTAQSDPAARDWRRIEEISYSFQIMLGPERPHWDGAARMAVLADRSPVVLRAVRGEFVDPLSNSPNHASGGQHLLFTDGSGEWYRVPVLKNGDNIWLPREIERHLDQLAGKGRLGPLKGTETPNAADDVFLGP